MKREILYKRPQNTVKKEVKPVPKAAKSEPVAKKAAKNKKSTRLKDAVIPRNWDLDTPEGRQSKAICEWIESHPHFKWSRMVEDIGLKKSNFYTSFLKAPKPSVKADFLPKMAEIMANYGFKNNP